jgi:hypothetical protein
VQPPAIVHEGEALDAGAGLDEADGRGLALDPALGARRRGRREHGERDE